MPAATIIRKNRIMKFSASLLGAALLLASSAAQAGYQVNIDASSLSGQTGYIDFSLIGLSDSPSAQANIRQLLGISLNGAAEWADGTQFNPDGSVSLFSNNGSMADWLQPVVFSAQLSFDLDFAGAWQQAASGSGNTFALKLLDSAYNPLLTQDIDGNLLSAELQPGQMPQFNLATAATVQAVPEPGTWAMLSAGLLLLGARSLRRR